MSGRVAGWLRPEMLRIAEPVAAALAAGRPVVALETAVLTHGLPAPEHLVTARQLEAIVGQHGAVPATIGIIEGRPVVGLSEAELVALAEGTGVIKASPRDLAVAWAKRLSAGTTVATTTLIAATAGIDVFATGGIGGVHRGSGCSFDVSADLPVLAASALLIVCAGAKTVLDLPATLEWLETAGVPVIGYGTDELPGFFVRETGLRLSGRVETPPAAAAVLIAQRAYGLPQAVLLTVPPPVEAALPAAQVADWLRVAERELAAGGVSGRDVTPYLLAALSRLSGGRTLAANLALLRQNAVVAARVAGALASATGSGWATAGSEHDGTERP